MPRPRRAPRPASRRRSPRPHALPKASATTTSAAPSAQGENVYTIDEQLFDTRIREFIKGGDTPDEVVNVLGQYLMFDPKTLPLDEQFTIVQSYLWANVLRMRDLNPYIPDAPSRSVMPQTDPSPIWQNYMGSGDLSYSFPTISYLG